MAKLLILIALSVLGLFVMQAWLCRRSGGQPLLPLFRRRP